MHAFKSHPRVFSGPRRQRGMVAMIIAIIVLVATLLAVIGLMRSVDTSNLIAGTMSFKQGVVQEAERAYIVALASINCTASDADNVGTGYYASVQTADATHTDLPGILTSTGSGTAPSGAITLAAANTGNAVYYMVERLCRTSGLPASKLACIVPKAYTTGGTLGGADSVIAGTGAACNGSTLHPQAAFRLSVRVDGPKNIQAFVQTIVK